VGNVSEMTDLYDEFLAVSLEVMQITNLLAISCPGAGPNKTHKFRSKVFTAPELVNIAGKLISNIWKKAKGETVSVPRSRSEEPDRTLILKQPSLPGITRDKTAML
jgi:hypothetical protein